MELSRQDCEQFLRSNDVGRVVYTDRALPAVIPVNYAFVEGRVILRVAPDSRPAEKLPGSVVAFQVDDLYEGRGDCFNVLVTGPCHRVSEEERASLLDGLPFTPRPFETSSLVLEIAALLLTGTRIRTRFGAG